MDRQSASKTTLSTSIPYPLNFDNQKFGEMYKAYNKIMILARDLNTQIDVPEFVFVGKDGHGKSSLIESFVGFPLGDVGANLRPLVIHMVNNPQNERPVVTIKRDRFLKGFEVDKVIDLAELPKELSRRNVKSSIPIKVQLDYRYCLNMQLIETPSIPVRPDQTPGGAQIQLADLDDGILSFTRPDQRILVFVEAASESVDIVELAKKLDPKLDRSIFVLNRFTEHLKTFNNARDLNRFLNAPNLDAPTFFTTLPSHEQRLACATKDGLKDIIDGLQKKDVEVLEQLQYDKRFERNIGLSSFRHYVSELTWKRYQEAIPEVLKRLRAFRKTSDEQLAKLKGQLDAMTAGRLRVVASNYVMEFLQSIEKLIVGTLEGNPSLNGQTLAEEKQQEETGEWHDHNHRPIHFDAKTWNVPFHESKVYGGQQFERLLAEFKSVCERVELGELADDEVAVALGSNKPTNVSILAWAASDIAQKKSCQLLEPLVNQLFVRAVYILRRLVDVVDRMIENKRRLQIRRATSSPQFESSPLTLQSLRTLPSNLPGSSQVGSGHMGHHHQSSSSSSSTNLINTDDHPYFIHSIREMYFRFIDHVAQQCKSKCFDEFYSTRLIYWDHQQSDNNSTNSNKQSLPSSPSLNSLSSTSSNHSTLSQFEDVKLENIFKMMAPSSPSLQGRKANVVTSDETNKIVSKLANKMFRDTRSRIIKNVMLKCYNFFLIPMQSELWGEVQGKITILSDQMLEELFETSVTKDRLKEDERHLNLVSYQFAQQEDHFLLAANTFAHPIYN